MGKNIKYKNKTRKLHNYKLVPAQYIHLFYKRSHLSTLKICLLIFSTNFQFIFTFKKCTTQFSHWIVSCTKNISSVKRFFSKVTRSFVAIELLTFFKNANFHLYCSRDISVFWLNNIYSLNRRWCIKKHIMNSHQN